MRTIGIYAMVFCVIATIMMMGLGMSDEEKPKTPEQLAWEQVDSLSKQSLESFLSQFPQGDFAQRAKIAVELQDKLNSIREGKSPDSFSIPFDVFGEAWKEWQERKPDKGVVGYFVQKQDQYTALGWFCPEPLSGGKTGGRSSISFDSRGILISPTGDGSIIGLRTKGLQLELFPGLVFETPGADPLYFGVVKDKGLIHLKGQGKVTLPGGKTTQLQ